MINQQSEKFRGQTQLFSAALSRQQQQKNNNIKKKKQPCIILFNNQNNQSRLSTFTAMNYFRMLREVKVIVGRQSKNRMLYEMVAFYVTLVGMG